MKTPHFVKTAETMNRFEVFHPESDLPHPTFETWQEALAAQKQWNKDFPGHKARKIPDHETPTECVCSINVLSISPPPVDKPFRVFFTGGGFLTRDGRLTYDFHSAMIFYSADEFDSLDHEIYDRLVYDVIGPINSDSFLILSSFEANIFVQFI